MTAFGRTTEIASTPQLTLTEPAEPAPAPSHPTDEIYGVFGDAFDYFNQRLFAGKLPPCLCTCQRRAGSRGYFAPARK
jgi:hypothetical protein